MFGNYFKIAIRNILKHKTYTLINVIGMAIGLSCAILIFLWVQDELNIDQYHQNKDQIYQAYLKAIQSDGTNFQETTSPAIAPALKADYPEILETARMSRMKELVFKTSDKLILEGLGAAVDPTFFTIFTCPFIEGDPTSVLNEPHSLVLTESLARKYFGNQSAVGQIIRVDNTFDFKVTGVIQDLPRNTYRKFDFVVPFVFLKELGQDIVGEPFYPCIYLTYIQLKENVSYQDLSRKIEQRIFSSGKTIRFEICLRPFSSAYLEDTGGQYKIMTLIFIALVILTIACINFTNLATARSTLREKEIGVRKVTGATRLQIARQFLTESLLITAFSAGFALLFTYYFLPTFNLMTSKVISLQFSNTTFLFSLLTLILLTGFSAGIYPALFLSRFQPIGILKRSIKSGKSRLRKSLIVFQFVLSVFFIVCTIVMSNQITFMQRFDFGVTQGNIIYVNTEGEIREKFDVVKHELLQNPDIVLVTSSTDLPIAITSGSYYPWGIDDGVGRRMCATNVGYDYLETFEMKMAAGRFYSREFPQDEHASIVVNETALRTVGLDSVVGKDFFFQGKYYTLIGVVKDFHHNKLLGHPPEPLTFWLRPQGNSLFFVKINPQIRDAHQISAAVQFIQNTCNRFSPERPLVYNFLDEFSFERERMIQAVKQIVLYSTILAIFLSCLGLFGLSMFISEQRTKEIGIRKTLGASVPQIVALLSQEYLKWVVLANLVAWPLAWFGMKQWLQMFAYKTPLTVWTFFQAGLLALMIAAFTVSWQAIRAATANPVEALRYE